MNLIYQVFFTDKGGVISSDGKSKRYSIRSKPSEDSKEVMSIVVDIGKKTIANIDISTITYDSYGNQWVVIDDIGFIKSYNNSTKEMSLYMPSINNTKPLR